MGLNPSGANGLVACTDAQFKKGVRTDTNECPAASKIGTVEVADAAAAGRLADRQRLRRRTEEHRSGTRAKSSGSWSKPSRTRGHRRPPGRQRESQPDHRPADGGVQPTRHRQFAGKLPEGLPQVPFESVKLNFDGPKAVLTSPPTCAAARDQRPDGTVGDGRRDEHARQRQIHAHQRPGRRHLPDDAGRAQVRAGLHGEIGQHQGRRLQPVPRPHRPSRRPAGAEGRQRHPAEGADRQTRRHPLLLGGATSRPRRRAAAKPSWRNSSCSGGEPDRHHDRPRPAPAPAR